MPLYEFECARCGETFEELVRRSEEGQPVECRRCGSAETRKLMSAPAATASGSCGEGGGGSGFG